MKNKIVIPVIIIAVAALGILIGFYFIQKNEILINSADKSIDKSAPSKQTEKNNQTSAEQTPNKLVTDDFEINLPVGWRKTAPALGVSAMAIYNDEQINDPAAQKINFKSYVAVSYDTLQGKSLSEYLQNIKNQLKQTITNVVFAEEHEITINGQAARAVEMDLTQQGVDFKILMIAVAGQKKDVWVMSFNTIKNHWDKNKEIFSDLANSFILKK